MAEGPLGLRAAKRSNRARRERELRQPIDSAMFANPVPCPHLVRMGIVSVTCLSSLTSRKKALLRFGYSIQTPTLS